MGLDGLARLAERSLAGPPAPGVRLAASPRRRLELAFGGPGGAFVDAQEALTRSPVGTWRVAVPHGGAAAYTLRGLIVMGPPTMISRFFFRRNV
jgi:hypothetical protein